MSNSIILGILGHIDHGKTSLIKCLNGFWGDSTEEEKQRGITMDLSFSNLRLGQKNIAFIDMPGHEKLIKNMIAGSFGMDGALLVVASNEGIMPQTVEHLEIARLLGIKDFIVVLTKSDLVNESILEQRTQEINHLFATHYPNAHQQTIPLSIYDKSGIKKLKVALLAFSPKSKRDLGFVRYYIDRSFSLKGIGCVVSGTLLGGEITLDKKLWSCELNQPIGIKSIQKHGGLARVAHISERVALGLQGINSQQLQRGYLLSQKGYMRGFDCIDVSLELLEDIAHGACVSLYIGAAVFNAKVLFLNTSKEFATLYLDRMCFSIFGERFILRSDGKTLGGGMVLNPIADPMKKSQKITYLSSLKARNFTGAFEVLLQAHKKGFGLIGAMQRFALTHKEALELADKLENVIVDTHNLVLYPKSSLRLVEESVFDILHKNKNALLSATLLEQKFSWISPNIAIICLENLCAKELICKKEGFFVGNDFAVQNIQEYITHKLFETLKAQGLSPLAPNNLYMSLDIDKKTGEWGLKKLVSAKKIIKINHKLYITQQALNEVLKLMRNVIATEGEIKIDNFKKHLNLSRKYLIAYLDYLDHFNDIKNNNGTRSFA